jgi:hypothetical protein
MKRITMACTALLYAAFVFSADFAEADSTVAPAPVKAVSKQAKHAGKTKAVGMPKDTATAPAITKKTAAGKKAGDTLVVLARITEIPGKFAPNDLYNYVYVMKYRVLKIVKGTCKAQEILIGQYNPLIPRARIKDNMKKNVSGNAEKFEVGAKQKLTLITPIDKVWKDAVDDEYPDSDLEKYFALRTDIAQ